MPKKTQEKSKPPVIALRGCSQHNLRGFDLDIPLGKLTVVTDPSGTFQFSPLHPQRPFPHPPVLPIGFHGILPQKAQS